MHVIDLCAGAGGKTLALAAEMADQGQIIAADTRSRPPPASLPQRARAGRGVSIVESRLLDPGQEAEALADLAGQADLVLVDAPCSGSGTWRRNPETRWRITPERLDRRRRAAGAAARSSPPASFAPGGQLVYAVCSLLAEEGRDQAAALTARSSLVPEDDRHFGRARRGKRAAAHPRP